MVLSLRSREPSRSHRVNGVNPYVDLVDFDCVRFRHSTRASGKRVSYSRQAPEQRLLDRLAKTEPNSPIVLSALGHMAFDEKRFSYAQQNMRRAIAAGSTKASDLDLYGQLLIHSGQMRWHRRSSS
jgi:uncharacterized protein HemY